MTRGQYHYGHLRERRTLRIALGRQRFIGENLVMFEFHLAWQGLISPACVLRTMSPDELDKSCLKLFHHQAIYRRFKRRTGRGLMMITCLRESKQTADGAGAVV